MRHIAFFPASPTGEQVDLNLLVILADRLLRQYSFREFQNPFSGERFTLGPLFEGDVGWGSFGRLHNAARYRAFLNREIIMEDSCAYAC